MHRGEARDQLLARIAFEAVWERDLDTDTLSWDESIETIFGYRRDEVTADVNWWRERVYPDDIEHVDQTFAEAIRSGAAGWANEYRFRRKDDSWAWVCSRCAVQRDADGRARRAIGAMIDITKLKEKESEVEGGQGLLRQVLDTLPVGVIVVDRAGDILLGNPEANAIWGGRIVDGAERRRKSKGFWHATGKAIEPDEWASLRAVRDGECSRDELIDIEAFDGTRKTIENYAAPIRDAAGAITGAVFVNEDVTERVTAADALRGAERELALRTRQLEALSRKLIAAQEAERRAVARELHDDFGQVLTALKLNIQRRERDDAESIALVDGAIARMRDLAQDLRPPLLDERGLKASLRWYVEREASRAGLASRVTAAQLDPRPPVAVETTCFRIAQEALTNVIRHAHARMVDVELSEADGFLLLVVRDDGRGFAVAAARTRAALGTSQGLMSMQERATLAGGELEIDSGAGRSTTIRARLPLVPRGAA